MEDYDIFDRFYRLLKKPNLDFISKEDFMPLFTRIVTITSGTIPFIFLLWVDYMIIRLFSLSCI